MSYGDPTGLWAVSFFIDLSGGLLGWFGSGQIGINIDGNGGVSITGQGGAGGGLGEIVSGSATVGFAYFPSAPSVQDLEGLGTAVGGSAGAGLGGGSEWLTSSGYQGWSFFGGFVNGVEGHAAGTYTKCWWGDCKTEECP